MTIRHRHKFLGIGSFLVVLLWVLSDPDAGIIKGLPFGASTVATILIMLKAVLYVGLLHVARKALLDYIDLEDVYKKAMETAEGAGQYAQAVGLMMIAIAIVIFAAIYH